MKESNPATPNRLELLKHSDWARGLAHALVRDYALAEDITQDALVLALQRPVQANPKSWLAGAVLNLVAQRRRKEARRGRREREVAKVERVQDHTSMIGEVEAQRQLTDHVMALDERNRDVLLWRYFRGETPRVIAAREGRSVAAISAQLTRAHSALRQRLEASGGQSTWLGALAPLLGDKTVKLAAASATPSFAATSSLAAFTLAGGKVILVAGLAACVWVGLRGLQAPSAVPGSVAMGENDDDPPLYGGTLTDAEPSEIKEVASLRAALRPAVETISSRPDAIGTARLRAHLLSSDGTPVPDATLILSGGGGAPLESTTDESGLAQWDEAPSGCELAVGIQLGGQLQPGSLARVELEAGRDHELSWTIHLSSAIRGVAVDEEGTPLPGLLLHLVKGTGTKPRLSPEYSEDEWLGGVIADEAGRFVFPPQVPGQYRLFPYRRSSEWSKNTLRADGSVDSEESNEPYTSRHVVAPYETIFEVPFNAAIADVTATFYTGGQIGGEAVSASDGTAVPGVTIVLVKAIDSYDWIDVATEASGAFATSPLPPGAYEITAFRGPRGWCPGEAVTTESGATDVKLPLVEAAAVQVRVEYAAGVEPVPGTLVIAPPRDGLGYSHRRRHSISIDQLVIDETTLTPGEYGAFFLADDGSCAGSLAPMNLGAGRLPGGLVVNVVPAAEVVVKNTSDDTVARVSYHIDGMQYDVAKIEPGEEERMSGPRGNTTLLTTGDGRKGEKTFSLEAVSGETAVIEWR